MGKSKKPVDRAGTDQKRLKLAIEKQTPCITSNPKLSKGQKKRIRLKRRMEEAKAKGVTLKPTTQQLKKKERKRAKKEANTGARSPARENQQQAKNQAESVNRSATGSDKTKRSSGTILDKFREKLSGSQFRMINEKLYTTHSKEAVSIVKQNPELMHAYHRGFARQVSLWPQNPVDSCIALLNKKAPGLHIGDFGCGEAKIAATYHQRHIVHSFDLAAVNEYVTVCDIANVPLDAGTLDVAIFCLSLMGSNYGEFLAEAHRTLKPKGELVIAEVSSRITSNDDFVRSVEDIGFECKNVSTGNTHFAMFRFTKAGGKAPGRKAARSVVPLKPCIYKRR
eukprot:Clim_evm34s218 gene=Clim_evmTU34s218